MRNNPGLTDVTSHDYLETSLARALKDVFVKMFNEQVQVVPHTDIIDNPRISAIIGFAGRISGFLCIHVDRETACSLAAYLLGMDCDEIDSTVCDAMGEMTNMVAGGLKNYLSCNAEMFKISIPSVIEGQEYSTHVPANAQNLIIGISAGKYQLKAQLVVEQN